MLKIRSTLPRLPLETYGEERLVALLEDLEHWRLHVVVEDGGPSQTEDSIHWMLCEVIENRGRDAKRLDEVGETSPAKLTTSAPR